MGRHWGRDFDEAQLRNLVRTMTPRSRFFQVLREELKRMGRWKYLPRGKPGDPLKQARQIDANDDFDETYTKLIKSRRSRNPLPSEAVSDSAVR